MALLFLISCGRAPAVATPAVAVSPPVGRQTAELACDESLLPPSTPLRRLSVREYKNTLTDLFAQPALQPVLKALSMDLDKLPLDGDSEQNFSNMDARTSQRHVETYIQIAEHLAGAVASDDTRLSAVAGTCALGAVLDRACFRRFLSDFGQNVFRRPLADAELEHFSALASNQASARAVYQQALTEMLAAPEFLFHVERGPAVAAERPVARELDAYELASRLSYHFWQTSPDSALFQAAASGALSTPAGYREQVERLVAHQRARSTWYRFFREWLLLEDFSGFSLDRAFNNFVGNLQATPELFQDAVWEVEQLVGYYTFDTPGSYRDLLTSELVLTRSARLAKLYSVEPWDGSSAPLAFEAGQRSGLSTRAALLISASHNTNPFRRGAFVRRRLLCEPIEPPGNLPPGALMLPVFDPQASTRTRYERKVESPNCSSCHDLFSPYGYALEAYDALGRYRKEERLLDDSGDYQGRVAVDTHVRAATDPGTAVDVAGPIEMTQALADSALSTQCFARQYFRFTFRRPETPADACTINALLRAHAAGGLFGAFRDVAYTDGFRHRSVAPTATKDALSSLEPTHQGALP